MSKFNPPEWARYFAQDADGWWAYYSAKPLPITFAWWKVRVNVIKLYAYKGKPVKNWRDQLYRIEWK